MSDVEKRQDRAPVPTDWTYAPAPESADIVRLQERYGVYVGGEWLETADAYTTLSPSSEEPLAEISQAGPEEVGTAVEAAQTFTAGVVSIFGDVFTLVGIMVVLVAMDWRLALVAFSVLPLIVVVTQWFRRNVRESYRTVRTWIARINAFLQEHITGMATVQLFRREGRSFHRIDGINRQHRDANVE